MRNKSEMVDSIIREITLSREYLNSKNLESIYFGGGTPSLLSETELEAIFNALSKIYVWNEETEITLEANPDDIVKEKVQAFKELGVNRWSIGIQSFHDSDLQYMNRAHNQDEAMSSVEIVKEVGIDKITIDLIYGTPTMDNEQWMDNLDKAIELNVDHISSYALTVEPGTALDHFIRNKKSIPVDDNLARAQFDILIDKLGNAGYEQYEISNFAKENRYAKHNTSYWQGKAYLGLGPSAHSYNIQSRQWNIANNMKYIHSIKNGEIPYSSEVLEIEDQTNEYIMTGLRTKWGIDLAKIDPTYIEIIQKGLEIKIAQNYIQESKGTYTLTREGKHFADFVAMELFV